MNKTIETITEGNEPFKVVFGGEVVYEQSGESTAETHKEVKGEERMERKAPQPIADQVILDYLAKHGQNPEHFRIVELDEFRDVMNSGDFEHMGLKKHVVPVALAKEAAVIDYDFTHTGIKLYNETDDQIGEKTVGLGYDDIVIPTVFSVEDLYHQVR